MIICVAATPGMAGQVEVSKQLSSEAYECFAFYVALNRCAPLTATSDELSRVQSWAERASEIAITAGKAAGMSGEELGAMHGAAIESVAKKMGGECAGFSAVRDEYLLSCKALLENASQK